LLPKENGRKSGRLRPASVQGAINRGPHGLAFLRAATDAVINRDLRREIFVREAIDRDRRRQISGREGRGGIDRIARRPTGCGPAMLAGPCHHAALEAACATTRASVERKALARAGPHAGRSGLSSSLRKVEGRFANPPDGSHARSAPAQERAPRAVHSAPARDSGRVARTSKARRATKRNLRGRNSAKAAADGSTKGSLSDSARVAARTGAAGQAGPGTVPTSGGQLAQAPSKDSAARSTASRAGGPRRKNERDPITGAPTAAHVGSRRDGPQSRAASDLASGAGREARGAVVRGRVEAAIADEVPGGASFRMVLDSATAEGWKCFFHPFERCVVSPHSA
jgi:hypothetical protein